MICDEEPPRPSLRLSSSQALPSISAQRQIEPAKLKKLVQGELDWIVMKCLEKDRSRRYETASAVAADLQHYLADEPVEARPATQFYRLKKFIRRNKAAVLAGAAVAGALVVGTTLALIGFVRATQQAEIARAEAARALKMSQRATQVQDFLRGTFTSINPESQAGAAYTVQQMLDQAGEKIDGSLNDQPEVRAVLHETMGDTYYGLQLYAQAMKHFRAAVDLRRRYAPEEKLPLANALLNLSKAELVTGTDLEDARANARESASILSSQVPESDWRRGFARALEAGLESTAMGASTDQAWAVAVVAMLPLMTDDLLAKTPTKFRAAFSEAKRLAQAGDSAAAIAVLRRLYLESTEVMQKLAAAGDRAGLEQMLREIWTPLLDVPWIKPYLPLKGIARAQEFKAQGGNPLIVEALLRGSIEIGHKVWDDEHPHIAMALHDLAVHLRDEGRLDEAESAARDAYEMRKKVLGFENPETVKSRDTFVDILRKQNKTAAAEKLQGESVQVVGGQ
jgi:tetratricopeptide (TPR) repeat protein